MAPTIKEILLYAKNEGASDVHVTVGIPPKMRVNGELVSMPFERMLPADTMELLSGIMNDSGTDLRNWESMICPSPFRKWEGFV